MTDGALQCSTTGLNDELSISRKVYGITGLASYSSFHKMYEPRPPCQWLCPSTHTSEQGLRVALLLWLPVEVLTPWIRLKLHSGVAVDTHCDKGGVDI